MNNHINNILIVRSIFCPNKDCFNVTFENLYNLFNYLNTHKIYNYHLLIIGWCKTKYINIIKQLVDNNKKMFNKQIFQIFSINYGKYKIINEIKLIANDYKYIFYSDHDISIPLEYYNTNNIFTTILDAFKNSITIDDKYIGFISLNQKEDVRHQYNIYQNEIVINNNKYIYPELGIFGSIASGCFVVSGKVLYEMDTLELYTVYGLDDYNLLKNLYKINCIGVVAKDIFVIHPFNSNDTYTEWKKNKVINLLKQNNSNNDNYIINYYEEIQLSHNFWNNF